MTWKSLFLTPGVHVPIRFTNCRPWGETSRHYTFDSNIKNAFAQRTVCDSCVLGVCEVYSQPCHRMSRTRTNGSNCRLSKTKQKKSRGKKKRFLNVHRWHLRRFWLKQKMFITCWLATLMKQIEGLSLINKLVLVLLFCMFYTCIYIFQLHEIMSLSCRHLIFRLKLVNTCLCCNL